MFEVKKDFAKLALSHYGYDGGNINSSFWISGIEWGGGISPEELKKDILNGPIESPRSTEEIKERERYLKYKFDSIWLKILASSLGDEVSNFRKLVGEETRALTSTGPMMKFNLYPISFKDTSTGYWTKDFYELTGFPTKELYMAWVQANRFPLFNKYVEKFQPNVILCSGVLFKRDFLLAFGGIKSLFFEPIEEFEISEKKKVHVFQSSLSVKTKIVMAPFFGSIHGTKSDEECRRLGTYLKVLLRR